MTDEDTGGNQPAFPTTSEGWRFGLTARQHAAIKLCVPDSGDDWLDDMIRTSLRDRFAGQALVGLVSGTELVRGRLPDYELGLGFCYGVARAMLAERDK